MEVSMFWQRPLFEFFTKILISWKLFDILWIGKLDYAVVESVNQFYLFSNMCFMVNHTLIVWL